MSAVLRLEAVVKRYGERTALHGVDLTLDPGQVVALLGPNGAGKSTIVGLASGMLAADSGRVTVLGEDPHRQRRVVRRAVGVAAQEIALYPALTVRQNLRALGELYGLRARAARARADELLVRFGLEELAGRPTVELSGGQRRRVHAAGALVNRPRLVLLDEPTAGADPRTRDAILGVVRDVAGEGAAVLYTTHYLPEVERLDADVALLEGGRVVAAGPLATIVAAHAEPVLELRFVGPAPAAARALAGAAVEEADGGALVRAPAADPGTALRELLVALGPEATALDGVEIVRPSLEAAYLALTGRRAAAEAVR
ncbi:ABC transporter ATP-binding protein [Patulibacter defluvii]|uniref:ABC transporter ATP-binding protein n=1 Tax=Patulibacter defluvii TaxID=3095358 RepID=UPI002A755064|nr:ABC transporter ATP-binding protein [Patulibacter sp. DM4]